MHRCETKIKTKNCNPGKRKTGATIEGLQTSQSRRNSEGAVTIIIPTEVSIPEGHNDSDITAIGEDFKVTLRISPKPTTSTHRVATEGKSQWSSNLSMYHLMPIRSSTQKGLN
jgi:hypothetical protein